LPISEAPGRATADRSGRAEGSQLLRRAAVARRTGFSVLRCVRICGGSSTGLRIDAAVLGPVVLGIGVEVIGVTAPAFGLSALGARHAVALGGIGVQAFRFGLSALGFRGLHVGIGVGLLGFGPALLCLGLASMQLVFGLGCLLADPRSFFALMF